MTNANTNQETGTLVEISAFENQLHKNSCISSTHCHQTHALLSCENPLTRFWLNTKNENKQGQKRALEDLHTLEAFRRLKMGMRKLSYTQLLEELRCHAIQQGLYLYGVLQKGANRKLQHN